MTVAERVGLSVFCGLMLGLGIYPVVHGFLLFFAFIPFFYLEDYFHKTKNENKSSLFLIYCWLVTITWNLTSLWWVSVVSFSGFMLLILYNSIFFCIPLYIYHVFHRNFSRTYSFFVFIIFFLGFEYVNHILPWAYPFLSLGNSFSGNISIIQWYEYTGVLGGSFWILVVNVLIYLFYLHSVDRLQSFWRKIVFLTCAVIVVVPVIISGILARSELMSAELVNVGIVQTDISPFQKHTTEQLDLVRLQIAALLSAKPDSINIVVFPETTIAYPVDRDSFSKNQDYLAIKNSIDSTTSVVLGVFTFQNDSLYGGESKNSFDNINSYNTAVFFERNNYVFYDKNILVTGVEHIPLAHYFPFVDRLLFDFGGIRGSLTKGSSENILKSDFLNHKIGVSICWEAVFGFYTVRSAVAGAQFLIVITNDGWWVNTPCRGILWAITKLRAVESRKYIIRSANCGVSGIINPFGGVSCLSVSSDSCFISGAVRANNVVSFYAKNGDIIGKVSSVLSVVVLLLLFLNLKTRK